LIAAAFRHQLLESDRRVDTEAIRRKHPIADVVSAYGIELRRAGAALVGRCPFHQDLGRPNMHLYGASGRWICYRCGERGDVIGFVQRMENLTFREAVAWFEGRRAPSRDVICPRRPTRPRIQTAPARFVLGPAEFEVLAAATVLYANQLLGNRPALAYMASRGFPRAILEQYHVGFAAGDELVSYLRWRRLPLGAALRAGLLTGDGHEFLAGRVVFPELRQGFPVWMIGRALESADAQAAIAEPKYLGLPGLKPLLGWEEAVPDTRGVCVVEGPVDLLALRLWGVPGLALAGSALRGDMLPHLNQFQRVYLALDNDSSGREGADRIAARLGSRAVRIQLPTHVKDVADLARLPHGEELFRAAIRHAISSIRFAGPEIAPAT
jgi:DNA primase